VQQLTNSTKQISNVKNIQKSHNDTVVSISTKQLQVGVELRYG